VLFLSVGKAGKNNMSKNKGKRYILRASFTSKGGKKIYAKNYGKRAFKIYI